MSTLLSAPGGVVNPINTRDGGVSTSVNGLGESGDGWNIASASSSRRT